MLHFKKSKMKTRKAQIRMTETIAVLFIFFVLLLFGILFYFQYQKGAIKEKQQELLAARAIDTTVTSLFMPELMCTKGSAEAEDNCFDLQKVKAAQTLIEKNKIEYYFSLLGFAKITVTDITNQQEYVIYHQEPGEYVAREPTYFVIALKDDTVNRNKPVYNYGYLTVEVYS